MRLMDRRATNKEKWYCKVLLKIYANNSKQLLLWLVQVYLTVEMKLSDYAKKKGFCARLYSIRRRTRKTECLIKCLEEEHEISSKTSNQI